MEFSLLHAGLAAGAALAAIPVILHLVLRQRPRRELFPALRLVRLRHKVTLRRLRLRHLLLLALRMLVIGLMALALARPSIHGASFIPDQQAPVAAALVFDTSLSMEYRHQDRTRLEAAQAVVLELLKELPDGSEVVVLEAAEPAGYSTLDTALARQRVQALRLRPRTGTLNQAVVEACRALKEAAPARKEVIVCSDLTEGCLAIEQADQVRQALKQPGGGAGLYLLNVGLPEPDDAAIVQVQLSSSVIPANSDLTVQAVVRNRGPRRDCRLELWLDQQRRGTHLLPLSVDGAARAEFLLRGLSPGLHQGRLVLHNGGRLQFDDQYYLTVEVRPVTNVLLVTDVASEAATLRDALAPPLLVEQQRARYRCKVVTTARLPEVRLSDYQVVFLVNVGGLSETTWQQLESFVWSGGGLGVLAGYMVQAANYNQELPQRLLAARLGPVAVPAQPVQLRAVDTASPVVRKLHQWSPDALGQVIVERYVQCQPAEKLTRTVIEYTDGSPALLLRAVGGAQGGRVLLCTTSLSPGQPGQPWNDLPQRSVQYVMLADGLAGFLAGHSDQRLDYQAGEDVVLRLERDQKVGTYLLHTPDSKAPPTRRSADPHEPLIAVPAPELLGNYRVTAAPEGRPFQKGFSVNAPANESSLHPLPAADLDRLFGKGRYAVVHSMDELRQAMGDVRIGRELFPILMPIILLLFCAEHFVANRFYSRRSEQPRPAAGPQPRSHAA